MKFTRARPSHCASPGRVQTRPNCRFAIIFKGIFPRGSQAVTPPRSYAPTPASPFLPSLLALRNARICNWSENLRMCKIIQGTNNGGWGEGGEAGVFVYSRPCLQLFFFLFNVAFNSPRARISRAYEFKIIKSEIKMFETTGFRRTNRRHGPIVRAKF